MSLEDAERLLFDVLFDEKKRSAFLDDRQSAFAGYELSEEEREDFLSLDARGLTLDAHLRQDLMLARLCRAFPLMFSIVSSLPSGLELLRGWLGPAYVRSPRVTRTARYGKAVREALRTANFTSPRERTLSLAIVDVEVALALASAELRERALRGEARVESTRTTLPLAWDDKPLRLASHVVVAVLPRSYAQLKKDLCPVEGERLWARLSSAPLPRTRLSAVLAEELPRLFLARAVLTAASRCEATVQHTLFEMPEGFFPLLRTLDGTRSANTMLAELERVEHEQPPNMLRSVRDGLQKLTERGLLIAGK
jgi:hypothetical protein